jgi:hypothetical protein
VVLEVDALAEEVEELLEGRRYETIAEELLLGDLTRPLVQHPELEARDEGVFVVPGDEAPRPRADDRHQVADAQRVVHRLEQDIRNPRLTRRPEDQVPRLRSSFLPIFFSFLFFFLFKGGRTCLPRHQTTLTNQHPAHLGRSTNL